MGPLRPALAELTLDDIGPGVSVRPDARIEGMVREYHELVWRALRRYGLTPDEADEAAQRVFVIASRRLARASVLWFAKITWSKRAVAPLETVISTKSA